MQRTLIALAVVAVAASTADACSRCGRSSCKSCNTVKRTQQFKIFNNIIPLGIPVYSGKPIAEQGNTVYTTNGHSYDLQSIKELAIKELARVANRKIDAANNAANALGAGAADVLKETYSRTTTTTTTEKTERAESGTTDFPDDVVDPPRFNSLQRGTHPFQQVVKAECASCHTGGKASGGVSLDDVASFDEKQWARVRKAMDPATTVRHMPPKKTLPFEQRDRAR